MVNLVYIFRFKFLSQPICEKDSLDIKPTTKTIIYIYMPTTVHDNDEMEKAYDKMVELPIT